MPPPPPPPVLRRPAAAPYFYSLFKIFQSPPFPGEVIKIYFPPLKGRGGGSELCALTTEMFKVKSNIALEIMRELFALRITDITIVITIRFRKGE